MATEKDSAVSTYAEDIHKHLKFKEKKRFLYRGCSPQRDMRKNIISYMDMLCEKMKFCSTAKHLSVYLMDIFMDNHSIDTKNMEMVTVGCIIVAVKLEEQDKLFPKNSDFQEYLVQKYELSDFVQMEVTILNFFNWNIIFPTAAHFTDYYLLFCINPDDVVNGVPILAYEDIDFFLKKYIHYFLDVSIREEVYLSFVPSLVAASCIAATRLCLMLQQPWTEVLERVTYFKYIELDHCIKLLIEALDEDMMKQCNKSSKAKYAFLASKREVGAMI